MLALSLGVSFHLAEAQETVYQVDKEVSVINYGDGRLLFRRINEDKTPLNGENRIIDGYRSEYILAGFKNGMYDGKYRHFKSDRLVEEGFYKDGRKDGLYKEYYSDGEKVKKETPYKEGKLNGIVKSYYTNGKPEKEKGYAMGVEDGIERIYDYESGEMTTDKNYKAGKLHGKQRFLTVSNTGNFVTTATYEEGKPTGEYSAIFTDGTIKEKGTYGKNGRKEGKWLVRNSFKTEGKDRFGGKCIIYKDGKVASEKDISNFQKYEKNIRSDHARRTRKSSGL